MKVLIIIIAFLVILASAGIFLVLVISPVDMRNLPGPTINITYENFAEIIEKNPLVQDIPSDGTIILAFYNKTDNKNEKVFVLTRGKVEEKEGFGDILLSLPSVYIEGLTNKNLCDKITEAKNNGDLQFHSPLSDKDLLWKYKSMIRYRDCLGF